MLDAIARADGFSPEAGPGSVDFDMFRSRGGTGKVRHIPIKLLLSGADPSLNVSLHGGEEIRVPEASKALYNR